MALFSYLNVFREADLRGTILLRSNPSRQRSMGYITGGLEKRKDRKSRKSRREEKVVGFSSTSLFPARKQEVVTRLETDEMTAQRGG